VGARLCDFLLFFFDFDSLPPSRRGGIVHPDMRDRFIATTIQGLAFVHGPGGGGRLSVPVLESRRAFGARGERRSSREGVLVGRGNGRASGTMCVFAGVYSPVHGQLLGFHQGAPDSRGRARRPTGSHRPGKLARAIGRTVIAGRRW